LDPEAAQGTHWTTIWKAQGGVWCLSPVVLVKKEPKNAQNTAKLRKIAHFFENSMVFEK
jgi:hypothetical protein